MRHGRAYNPNCEYINLNGVLPDDSYSPPRMIECNGYIDLIESCDECCCYQDTHRRCRLIARVSVSLNPRVEDKYTIHPDCPLKLYTSKK